MADQFAERLQRLRALLARRAISELDLLDALEQARHGMSFEQFEAWIQVHFPQLFAEPLPPRYPVMAIAGTPAKIEAMRQRLERCQQIFHPADLPRDPLRKAGRAVTRGRNGQAIAGQITLGQQLPTCPACGEEFRIWAIKGQRQELCPECEPVVAWRRRLEEEQAERRAAA